MTPERLRDLAGRLFDEGSLSPEEERELGLALQQSPDARRYVLSQLRVEGAIVEHARAGLLAPVPVRTPVPAARSRRTSAPGPGAWVAGLAAAALLALLLLVAETRPTPPAKAPIARAPESSREVPTAPTPAPRENPPLTPPAPKTEGVADVPLVPRPDLRPRPAQPEVPQPPAAPEPALEATAKAETSAAQDAVLNEVVLERVDGEVAVVAGAARGPARTGDVLKAGQGVETGPGKAMAVLSFPDGTRIEARADTLLRDVRQKGGPAGKSGKAFYLQHGSLWAEVRPQPAEHPLVISSPRGEARVVGTVFTLKADADPKGTLRLDVQEGKVRFTRSSDARAVDVGAGHSVSSGQGPDLVVLRSQDEAQSFQDGRYPAPDYAGTRDTQLAEKSPQTSYGGAKTLQVEVEDPREKKKDTWPLLRWDLSSIPPGSKVHSVSVTLHVLEPSRGQSFSFYEPARAWSESEATWKFASAGALWRFPGSLGAVERWGLPLGTLAPLRKGDYTTVFGDAGIALAQSWVNAPATNLGLQIAGTVPGSGFHFSSREAPAPDTRPRLTVVYTPKK
jgi:ferric-dicitrate binding protein FerR (iron transport regulator)